MKIKSSQELLAFYRWWFENKAELEPLKCYGLCFALTETYPKGNSELEDELVAQFMDAELDCSYPFGCTNYGDRRSVETQHLDPLRIAWVEARIADMED